MPREASITYDQVAAIADAIKASGAKPNPRLVRERHGSGSLGTVHKFFQQWRARQERQVEASLTLPPALQRAILEFMDQELTSARAALEADLADAQQASADLATENERQATQIDTLQSAVDELGAEKAALVGRVGQMEQDLTSARDEASREREGAEAARTELAKAQLRLEAMPILEKENERLQKALDIERTARTDAERQAATAGAKADGLAARLADTQAQHLQISEQVKELQTALNTERTARTDAERQAASAGGKVEELGTRLTEAQAQHLQAHEQIKELQTVLNAERIARTDAERQAANAGVKVEELGTRLAEAQTQAQQLAAQAKEGREALLRSTEQLAAAQAQRAQDAAKAAEQVGHLQGTVAALEKQLGSTPKARAPGKGKSE